MEGRGRERGDGEVGFAEIWEREPVVGTSHEDALAQTGVGGLRWMIPQ